MKPPEYLKDFADGALLAVKLQPRSSRDRVVGYEGTELRVTVTAPPVEDAANEALVRLIAAELGLPRPKVRIVRGHRSRHKLVQLGGLTAAEAFSRLKPPATRRSVNK